MTEVDGVVVAGSAGLQHQIVVGSVPSVLGENPSFVNHFQQSAFSVDAVHLLLYAEHVVAVVLFDVADLSSGV